MSAQIPGNVSSTASISVNSNVSGSLESIGDTDWYRVQFQNGYAYQIWVEGFTSGLGTLVDPYVAVFSSTGAPLAAGNDISLANRDAFVTYVPLTAGTYFVSAEEYGNNATGSYRLTVWQDQLNSIATAATIATNTKVTDRIGWGSDLSDWFAVNLTAGVNYQFDLVGSVRDGETFALTDPYLWLRSATGTALVSDDNSGVGLGSRIFFTPSTSGVYYLDVQESGANAAGVYSLIVNEAPVVGSLQIDGSNLLDSLRFPGDTDLFSITLTAGVSYGFSISSGTLADPYLELLNSRGAEIVSDDDSGPGLSSLLSFTPTTSGTYFLAARDANQASTGSFTVQAWTLPSISVGDASITEGNSSTELLNFKVTLSKASPVDVSFTIGTRAGTASTAGGDYQGVYETSMTIPAGQTSGIFSITVNGDAVFEPNEGFTVVISDPTFATIADGTARGWIFDDDAPYALTSEPLSRYQWHLYPVVGVNIFPVWTSWDGSGIKVAVFDQGIDSSHPDLNDNLLTGLGRQAVNLAIGGNPVLSTDNHGTVVAGVIAAESNGSGLIGIAPKVSLVSIYSSLSSSDQIFSREIVNAFTYAQNFDVLNNSWGFGNYSRLGSDYPWAFQDNFQSGTFSQAGEALRQLAGNGRAGLGTIVVQSAGNSFGFGDDTNLHNFQNSRYIITVAGTDYQGTATSYSSPGASVLIAAPGGERNVNNDQLSQIFTTDRVGDLGYSAGDYTFVQGTSFSGPIVSGIVALMLDANPTLGYRDVQQIIAYSGKRIGESENTWAYNGAKKWNGGGLHFDSLSHNLGFGLIDALTAVRLAETWTITPQTSANVLEISSTRSMPQAIPDGTSFLQQSVTVTQGIEVERVEVTINLAHSWIGDLGILLTSPAGTNSWLLWRPGKTDTSPFGQSQNNINFTFNTVLSMGESSVGVWTLSVFDEVAGDIGSLNSWTLNLIGKPVNDNDVYIYTNEFSESAADQSSRTTLTDLSGVDEINASSVTTPLTLYLASGAQSIIDGRGLTIGSGSVIENAIGGDGNDLLVGNQVSNSLRGMRGDDKIYGGDGDDWLDGGAGNDTLVAQAGADSLFGGDGDDAIYSRTSDMGGFFDDGGNYMSGGSGADSVYGGLGGDTLFGGDGDDSLVSGAGNDSLFGGTGNDYVNGGDGDDRLEGGPGDDQLHGGSGLDTISYQSPLLNYIVTPLYEGKGNTLSSYLIKDTSGTEGTDKVSLDVEFLDFSNVLYQFKDGKVQIANMLAPTYALAAVATSYNEGTSASFTVTTTNVAANTSLSYAITGVNAADITGGSLTGTTTVGVNGQAKILIPLAADQTTEGEETLTVTVQGQSASTRIIDSSKSVIQFAATSGSATEGNSGTSTITVQATLSAASTQAVTVPVTYSGTATSGTDYSSAATSITIAAGQTTGSASFSIIGDTTLESNETVILTMGTPTNATLGANTNYTHTITNDDLKVISLSGVVVDGYISTATIYLDANGNGLADPEERTGLTTDEQGRFSGTVVGEGALIAVGGINTDTGLANALPLGAPSGSAVISPLTTLVQQVVKSTGVGTLEASAAVGKALGLPSAVDLLQFDPLASPQESAAVAVQRANVQVATTISIAGTSVVESLASEIVTRSASNTILDLSSAATLSKLAPAVSAGVIQSLSDANATIKSAPGIVQIAQSQKAALIASGRAGTESDDRLTGDAGDDQLSAGKGKDKLQGGAGSDKLDGGDGIDTAIFEKARSAYKTEKLIQDNTTIWKVTDLATGDVDELRNIEKLEFAKASVAGYQNLVQTEVTLDVAGTPAVAYRLYKAAFARDPDLGGLGYWISALEQYLNPNLSPEKNPFLLDVAKTFVESPEFKAKYGADVDNATYIRNLYKNALGRDPLIPDPVTGKTDEGYTYWVGVLDAKAASRSDLFVYFSESTENKAAIAPIIATGVEYVPWVPPGG